MISVPIPVNKEIKLTIKYIPYSLSEAAQEFVFSVGEYVTINEIK